MPQAADFTLSVSLTLHALMASKLFRSLFLDPEVSKRVRLQNSSEMGGISRRHTPPCSNTSIPSPRRHGRVRPSEPLHSLPDLDSRLWPYGRKPFLGTPL